MQPEYSVGDTSYSSALALNRLQVYISNNINYYDSLLIKGYYQSPTYILATPLTRQWPMAGYRHIGLVLPGS